jgi:hypothetical protein
MSRNHYTWQIRKIENARITAQQKALTKLARELHSKTTESVEVPVADDGKRHRRVRLEQTRRHRVAQQFGSSRASQTSPDLSSQFAARSTDNKEATTHDTAA